MNIIFMGNFLYPKGMAGTKRIQHFIDYLYVKDIIVKVLLLRQGKEDIEKNDLEGNHKGIYYKTIGNELRTNFYPIFRFMLYILKGSVILFKWKRKNMKNIIYCYGGLSIENIWFIIFAKLLSYKIVFDIVEDISHFDDLINLLSRIKLVSSLIFNKYIHVLSDGIIVISFHLLRKYEKQVRQKIPIKLIPISAIIKKNKKRQLDKPAKIVYSGSYGKKDGLDCLLNAFENIYKKNKEIKLYLTGKGNIKRITNIKQNIKNNDAIIFLGYLDDDEFYNFIQKADILCIPRVNSKYANAGFPFKLGEYLATGNPVITSNISDVSFYLRNMKDAILIKPGNARDLQYEIEYLLGEPKKAMEIGHSGQKRCLDVFDPQKNGKLLLNFLKLI